MSPISQCHPERSSSPTSRKGKQHQKQFQNSRERQKVGREEKNLTIQNPNTDMTVKIVQSLRAEIQLSIQTGQTEAVFPVATRCQNRRDARRKSR